MKYQTSDLGTIAIPTLFKSYLIPTLLGMIALCAVTATDGIFVGQGIGSDGLAAVNICIPPTMLLMGVALMLGVGTSVVASIHLANGNIKAARINITQSLCAITALILLFLLITLSFPATCVRILGCSESLLEEACSYMVWIFPCCLFQAWSAIGMFVIRLDGSPKYAMWCNVIPGLMNVVLDYVFIFPLDMGIRGVGIATLISCVIGGLMVVWYLLYKAYSLTFISPKTWYGNMRQTMRNLFNQCKIGISAMLGEATMGMLMLMGNLIFMRYLGNDGVGAFSIACYYSPFIFMIGNAIAQSAQPIISYNYGMGSSERVAATERLAIISAIICGSAVMASFIIFPSFMVSLFLDSSSASAAIAVAGLPLYACAFIFFIFNLTAIGYYQSVERITPSIVFALMRGAIFLIPSFLLMPVMFGTTGIWLSLLVSEALTSAAIATYYLYTRNRHK